MRSGPAPKGPRLWLEPARVLKDGRLVPASWCIRDDGRYKHRTGFGPQERWRAEEELRDYIASKRQVAPGELDPSQRLTADVLKLYATDVAEKHSRPKESAARLERLILWWGQPAVSMEFMRRRGMSRGMSGHITDIDAATCKAYAQHVGAPRSASMDIEMLRAAMNHAVSEGKLTRAMRITLPDPPLPRERWLSRSEVAAMVWSAWRFRRAKNGRTGEADDLATRQHVARFILASVYTGTRKTATLLAAFDRVPGYGYIDLDRGLWYRQPSFKKRTTKLQPSIPLNSRLLSHMRRWHKSGQRFLVEYNGEPVIRLDKAYRRIVSDIGLGDDVVVHTLRHTAITWGLQNGMSPWDAAGFFGISLDMLMRVYGHHCPSHLRDAANRMVRPGNHNSVDSTRFA